MKTMTVLKRCLLSADRAAIFARLQELKTLQYIAAPYASFETIDTAEEIIWAPGRTYAFRFRMFCVIPYGVHTIHVLDFSPDAIYTHERNTHVPVWNHRIRLKDNGDGTTAYSDEVEIGAGWKTVFVWLWANAFYVHRQRKWRRLLKTDQGGNAHDTCL